jgi:hypothetical protein
MGETTTPPDRTLSWYLGSSGDQGTPRGEMRSTCHSMLRCRVDRHLHLVTARVVLELAAMGCTVACCGALIVTPELVLRAGGTACGMCLATGSA